MPNASERAASHGLPEMSPLAAAVRRHRKAAVVLIVLLVLAAGVYAFANHAQEEANRKGLGELYRVLHDIREGRTPQADHIAAVDRVIAEYGDASAVAYQGLPFIFEAQRRDGQRAVAANTARRFLANFPRSELTPDVRLALVKLLTVPEQANDARAEFKILERNLPPHLAADAALARAQIEHAAAQGAAPGSAEQRALLEEAREAFQRFLDQGQTRNWPDALKVMARFELAMVQDRLAGRTPAEPEPVPALLPAPEMPPASTAVPSVDAPEPSKDALPAAQPGEPEAVPTVPATTEGEE